MELLCHGSLPMSLAAEASAFAGTMQHASHSHWRWRCSLVSTLSLGSSTWLLPPCVTLNLMTAHGGVDVLHVRCCFTSRNSFGRRLHRLAS